MSERSEIERTFSTLVARGEIRDAVAVAVRGYGPEILAFLHTLARRSELAEEAFALFCEDLIKGAATYDPSRASLRTWAYVLARHALVRASEHERRHAVRRAALDGPLIDTLLAETRESTVSYLRTDVREGVERLRAMLSAEDQMLLYLRVERGMKWSEVVEIVRSADEDAQRAGARLRKRFERACVRLREMAAQAGLRE